MKKLVIVNIEGYKYTLKDKNEHNYVINLEFFDIQKKPLIGNYIYIGKELLDKNYDGYSTSYTFGSLENKYGKKIISLKDIDIIKIVLEENSIYLKRLYG